jgi:manganese/iron transport system permease protein
VRGLAYFGDALIHAVFPGIVIAYLAGANVLLGGVAAGTVTAVLIGVVSQRARLDAQTSIGVVFPAAFALGILLLSQLPTYTSDLQDFLFGNILGVSWGDLVIVGLGTLAVAVFLALLHRALTLVALDRDAARLAGFNPERLDLALFVALALVIVLAVQIAGNLLILSLLVTPAAAAWLLCQRFAPMLWLSALFGLVATVAGVYASFHLSVPIGPGVVMACTATFAGAAAVAALRRRLARGSRLPAGQPLASEPAVVSGRE